MSITSMPASLSAGLLGLALAMLALPARAQTDPRAVVEVGAVAQSYPNGDNATVSELTIPLRASVMAVPGILELSARTAYGSVSGDGLESLSGLGDTQVGANVRRPVGGGLVDLSFTASLPTGQTSLSDDQFATASVLALDDYAFALPSLGQGMVIVPGLTVAVPVGSGLALGVGASYSMPSAYTPFDDGNSYAPADETILTAGFDASLGGASRFTLEGSYVMYGQDTFGTETFSPGDKIAGRLRLALGSGAVRGSFLARYRQVGDGTIGTPIRPVAFIRPNQAQVALGLTFVQPTVEVGVSSGLRYYGSFEDAADAANFESSLSGQQVLLDLAASPSVRVGPNTQVTGTFTYTLGIAEIAGAAPFSGFRAGGGVRVGI